MPHMLAQEDPEAFAGLLAEFGASQPFTFLEAGDTPAELASRFLEARGVDVEDVAGEDESFDFAALHDPLIQTFRREQTAAISGALANVTSAVTGTAGSQLTEDVLSDPLAFILGEVPGVDLFGLTEAQQQRIESGIGNIAELESFVTGAPLTAGELGIEDGGSPTESGGPSEGGTSIPDGTGTGGGGGGTGGGGGGAVVPTEGIPFAGEGGLGGGLGLLAVAAVGVFLLAR